ncbi:MAG: hypothetical protein IJH79_19205 [Lentisphaeria bacterium]|nr:hypothetical protein [Lentisphaeria bacterium]
MILAPDTDAKNLRLSLNLRGTPGSALTVFIVPLKNGGGGKGISAGKTLFHVFKVSSGWQENNWDFKLPKEANSFRFEMSLYGSGSVYVDDVQISPVAAPRAMDVILHPFGFLDNIYVLGEGLPGAVMFAMDGYDKFGSAAGFRLEITLPPEIEFIDAKAGSPVISKTQDQAGRTTIVLDLSRLAPWSFNEYQQRHSPTILVKSSMPASEKLYPATYRLKNTSWSGSEKQFHFKVIPAVEGKRPKHFRTAAMFRNEFDFHGTGKKAAVDFYLRSGMNAVHGAPAGLAADLKRAGIHRYTELYSLANGFTIQHGVMPEDAKFRKIDGSAFPRAICPIQIYRRKDYFKKNIYPWLEKLIVKDDLYDSLMPNWEPYIFDSQGCFCPRCRDEFIAWGKGKVNDAEVRAIWPKVMRKYPSEWKRFRSIQHGYLVVTLEQTVNALGRQIGKDSHFVPEISFDSVLPGGSEYAAQYDPIDYMSEIPWIEPWGPYFGHTMKTNYVYHPTAPVHYWIYAKEMRDYVRSHSRKMPKMIGFPSATVDSMRIVEGDVLAMNLLSFFVRGWEGAFPYYFPGGYDYRYWGPLAKANSRIAAYEDYIRLGKDISDRVGITGKTPLPKPFFEKQRSEKEWQQAVHFRAFEHQGKILVAIGNFWQKGEHFFVLRVSGLKGMHNVSVPDVDCGNFSAEQLGSGILLQAGAARWQFVEIGTVKNSEKIFSQAQMKKLMEERLPAIRRALLWEDMYRKKHFSGITDENPVNDFSKIKSVESNKIKLSASDNLLQVTAPAYSLKVDPAKGGCIVEWQAGSKNLVVRHPMSSMFVPGFWFPAKNAVRIASVFKIGEITPVSDGVKLELFRKLTEKDAGSLAGLQLNMTYRFTGTSVTVTTKITNTTDNGLVFAFRYFNIPETLGFSGTAVFEDGTKFLRDMIVKKYCVPPEDPEVENAHHIDFSSVIKTEQVTMNGIRFLFPKGSLQMIIFWDGANQRNSTFEPVYRKQILAPKYSASFEMKVSF